MVRPALVAGRPIVPLPPLRFAIFLKTDQDVFPGVTMRMKIRDQPPQQIIIMMEGLAQISHAYRLRAHGILPPHFKLAPLIIIVNGRLDPVLESRELALSRHKRVILDQMMFEMLDQVWVVLRYNIGHPICARGFPHFSHFCHFCLEGIGRAFDARTCGVKMTTLLGEQNSRIAPYFVFQLTHTLRGEKRPVVKLCSPYLG